MTTFSIDIRPDHLKIVQGILSQHLSPDVKVWAFGSRVMWATKDSSDLDLALDGHAKIDRKTIGALEDAFEDSILPYSVDIVDLSQLSDSFREVVGAQKVLMPLRDKSADWSAKTLGQLLTFSNGRTSPERSGDLPHPVYGSNGTIGFSGQTNASENTIIIGRVGTYCGSLQYSKSTCWVTDNAIRANAVEGNDSRFLFYLLQTLQLNEWRSGSGQPLLNQTVLSAIPTYVPPLPEQRAIAHILGTLDDKIELNRRMNQTLEEMARAIFKDWFIDFGPTRAKVEGRDPYLPAEVWDLFPDSLVGSELGPVPYGWPIGVVDDLIELLSGGTPRTSVPEYWGGTIPWYTPKDAPGESDIFVLRTDRSITQAGLDHSAARVLPEKTTIITARGTVGRLACLGVPMAMNQTCYGVRGVNGYSDYFTYFNIKRIVSTLQQQTHGTIFDTITRQTFKLVDAVAPPVEIAAMYEDLVTPTMDRILENSFQSETLANTRDVLLPRLVSGELRVGISETNRQ